MVQLIIKLSESQFGAVDGADEFEIYASVSECFLRPCQFNAIFIAVLNSVVLVGFTLALCQLFISGVGGGGEDTKSHVNTRENVGLLLS